MDVSDEKAMDVDPDEEDVDVEADRPQDPILKAAELCSRFTLLRRSKTVNDAAEEARVQKELMAIYSEHGMIEFYRAFCTANSLPIDEALVTEWSDRRDAKLTANAEAQELAEKNEGDVEVHSVELKRAELISFTGTLEEALETLLDIKGLTTGKEIDKYLCILRLCLAWNDDHLFRKHSVETERLIEKGGDWDRRNRFTVYSAAHKFRIRRFEESAEGLLASIATFSATEIFDYDRLVKYVILASVLTLPRSVIYEKLICAPEIIQVIDTLPPYFASLLRSFYECRYNEFLRALIETMREFVRVDAYLNVHSNFFLREMRLRAYSQFLESYRSVRLESMAREFGVSVGFLDAELSSYIAASRLSCRIDKVGGVVHINRTQSKNKHYLQIVKKGDLLLNRIQRLSRIITY